MNDGSLIKRCLKQDKQAWNEFVDKYSALVSWAIRERLERFGYNFTQEDVLDIHQDVFFSIWRDKKIAQLRDKSKITSWLSMIAANKAIDYFKLVKRIAPPTAESVFSKEEGKEELALSSDGARNEIYANNIMNLVNEALEKFSPRERIILKFNILFQNTHQEIAEMLSMPVNTVSTVISRSKEKLREKLINKGIKDF